MPQQPPIVESETGPAPHGLLHLRTKQPVKPFPYRYAQFRTRGLLALLLIVLLLLGGMVWRNLERFESIRAYVGYAHRIQQVSQDLQAALNDYFSRRDHTLESGRLARLSAEMGDLARDDDHVSPETPQRLREVGEILANLETRPLSPEAMEAELLTVLKLISAMWDGETLERERLLEDIGRTTRTEVEVVLATTAGFMIFVGLFLRRRILKPLNHLRELLLRLADQDYRPIATDRIDVLVAPVFNSYNFMVGRLAELEESKRRYAETLESEVRSATRALLEQQATLARAERLAAVGELAAGIAHELRNPLAGIQLSCANLHRETADPEHAERLSLIIDELKRMGRLLNELLDQGRQTPVPVQEFNLAQLVQELVGLTRYQVPPDIELIVDSPDPLLCRLPECRIRQCLLNLILNATQALHDGPGRIWIGLRQSEHTIDLTVTDDGPGFPPDMLKTGIRPFATGRAGGTGLGLAMVQRFVRESGGRLQLANVEPHGARVTLALPWNEPE